MTDDYREEEFGRIAEALRGLPSYSPSPAFADRVMARVKVPRQAGTPLMARADVTAIAATRSPVRHYSRPMFDTRAYRSSLPQDYRRSIPARLAAATLVAAFGVTMATVALVAVFNVDLLVLVSRVFGAGAVNFLTAMAANTSATASGAASAVGTGAGAVAMASFGAGAVAATAALRAAAASANKRAA